MERQVEMVTFYIVRHGQTLLNQLNRAQGWADSPLTASGEHAAKTLGKSLSSIPFQAAYTSDTYRAFHTARLVLEENGHPDIPIHQDARLREWGLGVMEAEQNTIFIKKVSEWLGHFLFKNEQTTFRDCRSNQATRYHWNGRIL